jgi:hypothetical protein
MTTPFSTENLVPTLSNYPVAKGDTPGHPFRGNQWHSVAGGAAELSRMVANNALDCAMQPHGTTARLHQPLANLHRGIAEKIKNLVIQHGKEMTDGDRMRATRAIQAHLDAAQAHEHVASLAGDKGEFDNTKFADTPGLLRETKDAAVLSDQAAARTESFANTMAE